MVRNPKSKLAYQNCYGIKSLLMEKPKSINVPKLIGKNRNGIWDDCLQPC